MGSRGARQGAEARHLREHPHGELAAQGGRGEPATIGGRCARQTPPGYRPPTINPIAPPTPTPPGPATALREPTLRSLLNRSTRSQAPFAANARPALLDDDELLYPFLPDDALLPALCSDIHGSDEVHPTEPLGRCDVRIARVGAGGAYSGPVRRLPGNSLSPDLEGRGCYLLGSGSKHGGEEASALCL